MVASGMTKARARRVSARTGVTSERICSPTKRAKKDSMHISVDSAATLITSSSRKCSRNEKSQPEEITTARLRLDSEDMEGASDTEGVKEDAQLNIPQASTLHDQNLTVHVEVSHLKGGPNPKTSSISSEGGMAKPTRSSTPTEEPGRNRAVLGTMFSPTYTLSKGYSQEGAASLASIELSKSSAEDRVMSLKMTATSGEHSATSKDTRKPVLIPCNLTQQSHHEKPATGPEAGAGNENGISKHQLTGPLDQVVKETTTHVEAPVVKKCSEQSSEHGQPERSVKEPTPDVQVAESEPMIPVTDGAKEKHADGMQAIAPVPESDSLECRDEGGDDAAQEDDDYDDFDPYLFIKRLPSLSEVVSPCRQHLLPKQTRRCPPVTLVLDLDETLVHSTLEHCDDADFTFPVHFNNQLHTVYVRRRPYLEMFMERVAQMFEIIVFTASQSVYAEQLLNILDPQRKFIRHRIFRDSCVYVEGNYLKDLSILGRDLSKVAIIDNSPQAFGFQVDNGIPIESWFDDKSDCALEVLLPFLETLAGVDDVRPIIAKTFNLRERIAAAVEPLGLPLCRNPSGM